MKYYAEVELNGNVRNWFSWDEEKYPTEPSIEDITMIDITSISEEERALIGFKYDPLLEQFKKEAVLDEEENVIQEEVIVSLV
jgi:hypothetical protein